MLYSSPFRRLQDKAQVFSLETNAAIRSRLTHSLEVAHIGRSIAARFCDSDAGRRLCPTDDERSALVTIVETACLMHDLGNPPFGHFGETAIKEWFEIHEDQIKKILGAEESKVKKHAAFKRMYADFTGFDGNAQTLRIITKIQFNIDMFGLNLLNTQIAAVVKYPWTSDSKARPKGKKFGVFSTEEDVADAVWNRLALRPNQRHFLVYLVEAADDISYCMSDIEDAIEKGVVSWRDFILEMRRRIAALSSGLQSEQLARAILELPLEFDSVPAQEKIHPYASTPTDPPKGWKAAMLRFRTSVTRYLIDEALADLVRHVDELLQGDFKTSPGLLSDDESGRAWPLGAVKAYANSKLYPSRHVRQRELIAHRVIHGLLDHLFVLLDHADAHRFEAALDGKLADADSRRTAVAPSVASLLPSKYLAAYKEARKRQNGAYSTIEEWCQRAHLVLDYVSGMTDRFALDTYRLLIGVDTSLEK